MPLAADCAAHLLSIHLFKHKTLRNNTWVIEVRKSSLEEIRFTHKIKQTEVLRTKIFTHRTPSARPARKNSAVRPNDTKYALSVVLPEATWSFEV